MKDAFWRIFARRSALCFFLSVFMFLFCILRVAAIAIGSNDYAGQGTNRLRLSAGKLRGTIYDCNMVPLTNNKSKIIAAVSPTPRAITAISSVLEGEVLENALTRLKSGKPILCELPREINCDGISCTKIFVSEYEKFPATHLIGYTDSEGRGVSGLEAAYDELLYSESKVDFYYECDGKGNILEGISPEVFNDSSVVASGVVTTIDINIQNTAEAAAEHINAGAVVIAEADTGKLRGMVSRPYFDRENIAVFLDGKDSPLFNRAINAYNVGSVFKPCVAVAGIEGGFTGFEYTCTGSCEIIDRFFRCHKWNGHGSMKLRSALANSCNTYFYNYAFRVGAEKIYKTASVLNFGRGFDICEGMSVANGCLPKKATLDNVAQLANFSIGQGELLLSPVSILTLYCAIATDGKYYLPSVVEGTVENGSFKPYDRGNPTRAMKPQTAGLLREYLAAVLSEGTGKAATPKTVSAAGKTATAQTGKFQNGKEICEGWFCGFFPAENPKYVVVVFSENTDNQTLSCGEIFALIADSITEFKK